jgi:hypothetical protein
MEYLGLHNKPEAEVYTRAIMLPGGGGGGGEEEEQGEEKKKKNHLVIT